MGHLSNWYAYTIGMQHNLDVHKDSHDVSIFFRLNLGFLSNVYIFFPIWSTFLFHFLLVFYWCYQHSNQMIKMLKAISGKDYLYISPENNRKPLVFWYFYEAQKKKMDLKRVNKDNRTVSWKLEIYFSSKRKEAGNFSVLIIIIIIIIT